LGLASNEGLGLTFSVWCGSVSQIVVVAIIAQVWEPVLWLIAAVLEPLPIVGGVTFASKHSSAALLANSRFIVKAAKVAFLD